MARMLSNSMLRFLVIYTNTLFAFSLGATLLTQKVFSKPLDPDYDDEDERGVRRRLAEIPSTWFEMIKLFIWVSTGEVVPPGRMLTEARNPALMTVLYLCFLVVSTWMLMNLLISLMADTFRSFTKDVQKGQQTWYHAYYIYIYYIYIYISIYIYICSLYIYM